MLEMRESEKLVCNKCRQGVESHMCASDLVERYTELIQEKFMATSKQIREQRRYEIAKSCIDLKISCEQYTAPQQSGEHIVKTMKAVAPYLAKASVIYADALLAELEKTEVKE